MTTHPNTSKTMHIPTHIVPVTNASPIVGLTNPFMYINPNTVKIIILYSGCQGLVFLYPSPIE